MRLFAVISVVRVFAVYMVWSICLFLYIRYGIRSMNEPVARLSFYPMLGVFLRRQMICHRNKQQPKKKQ